jgi:hypothetical protein
MQTEQKQTHHGGTGEQETELGAAADEKRPEDPNTLQTGEPDEDTRVRNPSGDDIGDAVDGDEGSGRTV